MNIPSEHHWRYKLKEVIDIIETKEEECKNKPNKIDELPPIEIDETLLKDVIEIWSEIKPGLKDFYFGH